MLHRILISVFFLTCTLVTGQVNIYQDYQFKETNGIILESLKNSKELKVLSTDQNGKLILIDLNVVEELQKQIKNLNDEIEKLKSQSQLYQLNQKYQIEQINKLDFDISVYPNPSKNIFRIELNKTLPEILIVSNLNNEEVYKTNVNSSKINLDFSTFSRGVYFLNFFKNGQIMKSEKIVLE